MPDNTITGREPRLSTRHSQAGQRRLTLRGLGTLLNLLPPDAVSLEAIAAALRSSDFFVRYNAAILLGKRGDRDARLVLQDVLATGDAPARASAARQLHHFTWFAAEPLIRQALQDSDSRVREGVVYALCDMHDLNAYRLLAEALRDEADTVRGAAAWGLRSRRDPAAIPVLEVIVTRAADPDVRIKALEGLGATELRDALPVVRAAMADPDPDVKYAATLSLIELAGEACLSDLARAIRHADRAARAPLLRAFFHGTNYMAIDVARSPAVEALLDALEIAMQDSLPQTRMAVAWPLAWIAHPRASTLLMQAYDREQDEEVKAHLVRVAVALMSEASEEILRDALQSSSGVVRDAAELVRLASGHHRVDESHPLAGRGPIWTR